MSTDEAEVITDGEEEEEEEEDGDDNEDGEKADLRGDDDEVVLEVGMADEEEGRGLLIDRSTGSVCVWKCRS